MKYYAIGDIHGRYDLLKKAWERIIVHAASEPNIKIITLGDYIDRGPDSRKVIEFLMQHDEIIALQGNHEDIAVESIMQPLKPNWWMGNGGHTTLYSYGHPTLLASEYYNDVSYSFVPQEHVKWMATLPRYYEAEKQVFVHAGVLGNKDLADEADIRRSDGAIAMQWMLYGPSDHGGWRGKHVVHGHHQHSDGPHRWNPGSTDKDGVIKVGGRTNLDVLAWKTGRLVIGVFDDTQLTALEYLEVTDAKD